MVEYFIQINCKKSTCINFDERYDCKQAQLNEETIIWVNSVKHLGNIIYNDINNIDDCKMKCASFISYIVSMLMCNLLYCLKCSSLFVLFIAVQVYGIFLQKVLEKNTML